MLQNACYVKEVLDYMRVCVCVCVHVRVYLSYHKQFVYLEKMMLVLKCIIFSSVTFCFDSLV